VPGHHVHRLQAPKNARIKIGDTVVVFAQGRLAQCHGGARLLAPAPSSPSMATTTALVSRLAPTRLNFNHCDVVEEEVKKLTKAGRGFIDRGAGHVNVRVGCNSPGSTLSSLGV
jgi:hypothetical protein